MRAYRKRGCTKWARDNVGALACGSAVVLGRVKRLLRVVVKNGLDQQSLARRHSAVLQLSG
jgi:hypothetical protein